MKDIPNWELRPAKAVDVYQLQFFNTPEPDLPTAEVEAWVRGEAWYWSSDPTASTARTLLMAVDSSDICGVVAYETSGPLRHLLAIVLAPERRGAGEGEHLWMQALIAATENRTVGTFWRVHPQNVPALRLSRAATSEERTVRDDYVQFLLPPH